MRSFLLSILLLFLSSVFWGRCGNGPSPDVEIASVKQKTDQVQCDPANMSGRWAALNKSEAKLLFDNFNTEYRIPFKNQFHKVIPKSIWFDSTLVLALYENMKSRCYSGVRLYFGAYGNGIQNRNGYPDDESKEEATIFIVETKGETDENGNWLYKDQLENKIALKVDKGESAYDHAHLCPPDSPKYCGGSDAIFDLQ